MRSTHDRGQDLDFRILGPLEVCGSSDLVIDREKAKTAGPKARALLAILLLNADKACTTEQLIDRLWNESSLPKDPRNLLQGYIGDLRDALEVAETRAEIQTRGRGASYCLQLNAAHLDLNVFEEHYRDAVSALAAGRVQMAFADLEAALNLWRGPAFADLEGVDFLDSERRRLEDKRVQAVEARYRAAVDLGQHDAVIGDLQNMWEADPLSARLTSLLMRALYFAQRQDKVDDVYQKYCDMWTDRNGNAPRPADLEQLYVQTIGNELKLDASLVEQSPQLVDWRLFARFTEVNERVRQLSVPDASGATDDAGRSLEVLGLSRDGKLTDFGSTYFDALTSGDVARQQEVLAAFLPERWIVADFLKHIASVGGLARGEAEAKIRAIAGWSDDPLAGSSPRLWLQWIRRAGLVKWEYHAQPRPRLVRREA